MNKLRGSEPADQGQTALPPLTEVEQIAPWEQIESGRFQPRRIRGSYRGRELG